MARVTFLPGQQECEADENSKLLAVARRNKIDIRFGCAACRCGTCGVLIASGAENLTPMTADEQDLLSRMNLSTDGHIRLACRARIKGESVEVDLSFQDTYSPDIGAFDEDGS